MTVALYDLIYEIVALYLHVTYIPLYHVQIPIFSGETTIAHSDL